MKRIYGLGFVWLLGLSSLGAQVPSSPYAGQEQRPIKALSLQEIEGYQQGQGMGLAKAAELNGYPGPLHVLELAKPLGLSVEQKQQTQNLYEAMRQQAQTLGEKILAQESALDRHYASGQIEEQTLREILTEIARLQGELRFVHLRTHLQQKRLLTPEQIQEYQLLRGYHAPDSAPAHLHHH